MKPIITYTKLEGKEIILYKTEKVATKNGGSARISLPKSLIGKEITVDRKSYIVQNDKKQGYVILSKSYRNKFVTINYKKWLEVKYDLGKYNTIYSNRRKFVVRIHCDMVHGNGIN